MNKLNLYPCFDKWFEKGGSIWIYSDPHFNDAGSIAFRNELPCTKALSTEEQIKMINKYCGKNDTLIILGDIGDINEVKKLKAGYKVLIKGNHDTGSSNYQRVRNEIECFSTEPEEVQAEIAKCVADIRLFDKLDEVIRKYTTVKVEDNHLFDEVYDGILSIRKDIILSHEQFDSKYAFNIHGHDHYFKLMRKKLIADLNYDKKENYINTQLNIIKERNKKRKTKIQSFNCCCEWIGYIPLNLGNLIKSGILKDIPDIHREAIDKQAENSERKKD